MVARGDAAAFDAVYDLLAASVFGIVMRVIRDPAQSEEVTQDVLLEVWRNASKFDAADLHPLPASRGYELWLIGPAGERPVTMLSPGGHAMAGPVIASGLRPGDHLALTAEPAGGSARPSAPMMLDVPL